MRKMLIAIGAAFAVLALSGVPSIITFGRVLSPSCRVPSERRSG
jgi:hypothetical protein